MNIKRLNGLTNTRIKDNRKVSDSIESIDLFDFNVRIKQIDISDESKGYTPSVEEYFKEGDVMSYGDFIQMCNGFAETTNCYIHTMNIFNGFAFSFKSLTEEGLYNEGKYIGGVAFDIIVPPKQVTIDLIEETIDSLN